MTPRVSVDSFINKPIYNIEVVSRAPESSFEEFDKVTSELTVLLKQLEASWGEEPKYV